MRLLVLFLFLPPFILIETTFPFLAVSLMVVFSVCLFSNSAYRFFFAFLTGIIFDFFWGSSFLTFTVFFLSVSGFVSIYRSYFPGNLFLPPFIFLGFEIIFFLLSGISFSIISNFIGFLFFLPLTFLIRSYLFKDEEKQLQFDFLKP